MIATYGQPTSSPIGSQQNVPKSCDSMPNTIGHPVLKDIKDICDSINTLGFKVTKQDSKATSVTEGKVILITGSTGDVGRYLLHQLASSSFVSKAYAIIRADTPEDGREKLLTVWKDIGVPVTDSTMDKIVPMCVDFTTDMMGMTEEDYNRLSSEVDIIYHAGHSPNLLCSYKQIRAVNVTCLSGIIAFAMNIKEKELHYISSLAQFPSFISFFSKEYCNEAIDENSMPSFNIMNTTFDPEEIGFPWSMWAGETIVRKAHEMGLLATIYRPGFVWGSMNGYASLPSMGGSFLINMVNKGIIPSKSDSKYPAFTMVDTLSDIIVKLSTRTDRKHWVYNVIDPEFRKWRVIESWASKYCLVLKQLGHDDFFNQVQDSPSMQPFMGFVNAWKDYWFSNTSPSEMPVRMLNIVEDLGYVYRFPDYYKAYTATFRFFDEKHLFDNNARATIHNIATIVMEAKRLAGVPPEFDLGALTQYYMQPIMMLQVEHPNRSLFIKILMMIMARTFITNLFLLSKMEKLRPEILLEKIEAPIFIVGLNRSGTTFTQNMMAADKRNRVAIYLEMYTPYGSDGSFTEQGHVNSEYDWKSDPRFPNAEEMLENEIGNDEEWRSIHIQRADLCEEEYMIMEQAGRCYTILVPAPNQQYEQFLLGNDCQQMKAAYTHHKRFLQHLQHQVRGDRWVLKMPFHLFCLDEVMKTYPDAKIIFLHRTPVQSISSWCSLVSKTQSMLRHGDNMQIGQHELGTMGLMIDRALAFRNSAECNPKQFLDISYMDLVDNPIKTIEQIYQFTNTDIESVKHQIEAYIQKNSEERSNGIKHDHSMETYGLSKDIVEKRFENYIKFVKDKNLRL